MSDQTENLNRVQAAIAGDVIAFARNRESFYMNDLRVFVAAAHAGIAPDSPGRILRLLRQRGEVDYHVVNRSKSQYAIDRVKC